MSNAKFKIIGSFGEDKVIEYLNTNNKRLNIKSFYTPRKENRDYEHYDIPYITNDNKTFYIEVKSTKCNNIINILSANLILKIIKPSKYKLEGIAND